MIAESTKVALIISAGPTIAAIASLIASLRNADKLKSLHVDLNSRLTQLLQKNGAAERAEGRAEGVEQERTRPSEN